MEITAKRPWLNSMGEVPATLDYFQGSMVEAVEKVAAQYPNNVAFDFMGEVPMHLDYFEGSMFDMVKSVAERYPNNVAFDFMGKSTTYGEMVANIEKCARSLRTIGVRQNDRVTIAMPNCPQAIYMFYAVNMIGAVANMVRPVASEKELEF